MIARLLVLCAMLTLAPAAQAQEKWTPYVNQRFGTTIDYPDRFRPGRPPDNNDGLSFIAADGATLTVWGALNIEERDIAGLEAFLRDEPRADEQVTYRASGASWLVLSGTRGDRIFYQRHLLSHRNEIINAFEISYPVDLRTRYDPVVARLARTLRAGPSTQVPGAP